MFRPLQELLQSTSRKQLQVATWRQQQQAVPSLYQTPTAYPEHREMGRRSELRSDTGSMKIGLIDDDEVVPENH